MIKRRTLSERAMDYADRIIGRALRFTDEWSLVFNVFVAGYRAAKREMKR